MVAWRHGGVGEGGFGHAAGCELWCALCCPMWQHLHSHAHAHTCTRLHALWSTVRSRGESPCLTVPPAHPAPFSAAVSAWHYLPRTSLSSLWPSPACHAVRAIGDVGVYYALLSPPHACPGQEFFDPLHPLPHELSSLQELAPRGFNSALYKLPFVLDEELGNLSRFGVERATMAGEGVGAGGGAGSGVAATADPMEAAPGSSGAGGVLCSLPGQATPLLTAEDVRAVFGGDRYEALFLMLSVGPCMCVCVCVFVCVCGCVGRPCPLLALLHVGRPSSCRHTLHGDGRSPVEAWCSAACCW